MDQTDITIAQNDIREIMLLASLPENLADLRHIEDYELYHAARVLKGLQLYLEQYNIRVPFKIEEANELR